MRERRELKVLLQISSKNRNYKDIKISLKILCKELWQSY